ncbi:MAG: hypothetical protein KY463_15215 [Actinobacteria bacterium]|nr:hypothetical protein [Actinomycetota bacterium]
MFDTVLVAGRGVLSGRVVRACQRLGARAVTVHSAADAAAPHARQADESLLLGGPTGTWLRGDGFRSARALVRETIGAAPAAGWRDELRGAGRSGARSADRVSRDVGATRRA